MASLCLDNGKFRSLSNAQQPNKSDDLRRKLVERDVTRSALSPLAWKSGDDVSGRVSKEIHINK